MFFCCVVILSGRGLCYELITSPEESLAHWGWGWVAAPKEKKKDRLLFNDFGAGGETRLHVKTKVDTILLLNIRTGWYKSG